MTFDVQRYRAETHHRSAFTPRARVYREGFADGYEGKGNPTGPNDYLCGWLDGVDSARVGFEEHALFGEVLGIAVQDDES